MGKWELAAGVLEGDFGGCGDVPAVLGDGDGFGMLVAEVDVDGGRSAGGADADEAAASAAVSAGAECGERLVEVLPAEGLTVVAVVAIAEPVVKDVVGKGEGLGEARASDEGLTGVGGQGVLLRELQAQ